MNDTQALWEIIELADIAVRASSQLRLSRLGRPLRDVQALEKAARFLNSAENGGIFLSGQGTTKGFGESLRPLNWAMDTYLRNRPAQPAEKPDYSQVARYIAEIQEGIDSLLQGLKPDESKVESGIVFFERLGELLSARADQSLQKQPHSADYSQTAIWH